MTISEYKLDNWRELLNKDWDSIRQDNGSGNMEKIIETLFREISTGIDLSIKTLKEAK